MLYWNENSPIIEAKTYGYIQDYYILQENNLGLGSNHLNTLILSINKKTKVSKYLLCYHKIIDFLGDIYTTQIPYIKGIFYLHNPNHKLNNIIAKYIYEKYLQNQKNIKEKKGEQEYGKITT